MRKLLQGALLLLSVMIIAAGCTAVSGKVNENAKGNNSAANEQDQNSSQGNDNQEKGENDLSPTPDPEASTVKKTITLFFADQDLMEMYRLNRDIEADSEELLPKEAIKAWMEGPQQEGLANLVPPEVVVEKVELLNGVAHVSLSKEIKNANLGSSGEMFLIEQLTLIMKQFGCDSTQILVEGEAEESILGHVTTSEPVVAPNPDDYAWFKK